MPIFSMIAPFLGRFLPNLGPAFGALLNPWLLCLVVAGGGWLWFQGFKSGADRLDAYLTRQAAAETRVAKARTVVTERVVTKYIQVQGATRTVTEYIDREVAKYADQNAGLCLDADWRRVHDDAARNHVPGPASGPADALRAPAGAGRGFGRTDGG